MTERLSHKDLRRILRALPGLYEMRGRADFIGQTFTVLMQLIGCDYSSFNEIDVTQGRVSYLWGPDKPAQREQFRPFLEQHFPRHPYISYLHRTGSRRVRKLSDFVTRNQWHQLPLYHDYYRYMKVEFQLTVPLLATPDLMVPLALNRTGKDFTERDRLVLNLLQPHLAQALRNIETTAQFHSRLEGLHAALKWLDYGVIELTAQDKIGWASPHALERLAAYCGQEARTVDGLPKSLQAWIRRQEAPRSDLTRLSTPQGPLVIEQEGRTLSLRLSQRAGCRFLLMKESRSELPPAAFITAGLTPREAEVLRWVAQGKSNGDIATILGMSLRTVHKHMERIFQTLGVDNRIAATAIALNLARDYTCSTPHR